jgi:hypothetical protein
MQGKVFRLLKAYRILGQEPPVLAGGDPAVTGVDEDDLLSFIQLMEKVHPRGPGFYQVDFEGCEGIERKFFPEELDGVKSRPFVGKKPVTQADNCSFISFHASGVIIF